MLHNIMYNLYVQKLSKTDKNNIKKLYYNRVLSVWLSLKRTLIIRLM